MTNNSPQQTYNQYIIRKWSDNEWGGQFGITIPRDLAKKYESVKFTPIALSGGDILLKSGIDLAELRNHIKEADLN